MHSRPFCFDIISYKISSVNENYYLLLDDNLSYN